MHSASYGPVLLALVFWFGIVARFEYACFLVLFGRRFRVVALGCFAGQLAGWLDGGLWVRLGVGVIEWENFEELIRCYWILHEFVSDAQMCVRACVQFEDDVQFCR